ncbi:MAG: DUF4399 domain-containing protein, partial [Chloroflexi bacterium]|nr:DUF4399 domain-containing protein [Chloroflexota bacterium]
AYSESQIPAGTNEADLYAAWWNCSAWVKLTGTVNAQANTITAQVSHFTNVAVIAPRPAPPPPPPPTPAPAPTPAPPPPPPAPTPVLSIASPAQGATVDAGNIQVTVQVTNFELVPPGALQAGKGHLHYYLDVAIPTDPGKPAVTAAGTYKATPAASATWENVSAGTHTLGVQLVNADHTPLEPPITATITITVRAPQATPPAPPPPAPAPPAPAPAGFNSMWVVIPLAAIIVIVLVIYFVRRSR